MEKDFIRRHDNHSDKELLHALQAAREEIRAQREQYEELRSTCASLEAEGRRLRERFDCAPAGYLVTDIKGNIHEANRRAAQLLGVEPEALANAPLTSYAEGPDLASLHHQLGQLQRGEQVSPWEMRIFSRRGQPLDVVVQVKPAGNGRATELCWSIHELDDRQQAQAQQQQILTQRNQERQALEELAACDEAILASMTEGLMIFDLQGNVLEMNPAALRLQGFQDLDEVHQYMRTYGPPFELYDLDGRLLAEDEGPVARVLRGETFSALEVQARDRRTGEVQVSSCGGTQVRNQDGQAILGIVTIRDITEHARHVTRQQHLLAYSQQVLGEQTIEGLLQRIVDAARDLTGARLGSAGYGYQDGRFVVGASSRAEDMLPCPEGTVFCMERGGVYLDLIQKSATLRLTDEEMCSHPSWWGPSSPLRGLLGARLVGRDGQANGLIMVSDKEGGGEFTAEDEAVLGQLASMASLSLQHIEARLELEETRDRLESTLNSITDGFYALDDEWRFVAANRLAEEHFGLSKAELLGRNVWDLTGTVPGSFVRDQFEAAWAGGRPLHVEARSSIRADYWAEMHLYPRGNRLEVYFRDISDRKRAELQTVAALEAARRSAQFPEENPNPVLRANADGRLLYTNEAAQSWLDTWSWQTDEPLPVPLRQLVIDARGQAEPIEGEIDDPAGATLWLSAVQPPGEDYVNVYGRDITLRKRAESERERLLAENRHQRDLLERLLEAAPIAVAVVRGPDHRYDFVNPAYMAIPRTTGMPMLGRTVAEVFPAIVESGGIQLLDRAYRDGERVSLREYRTPIGPRAGMYWNAEYVPLHDRSGQVEGVVLLINNITERVQARQQIEELATMAQKQAEELNTVLENMVESVVVYDAADGLVRANRAAREAYGPALAGRDRPEIIRLLNLRQMDGRSVSLEESPVDRALRGEVVQGERYYFTHARKGDRIMAATAAPLHEGDRAVGAVVVWHDVTDEVQAELQREAALRAARESEEKLRTLIEIVPLGISVLDANGHVTPLNSRLAGTIVLPSEAVERGTYREGAFVWPDGSPLPLSEFPAQRALRERQVVRSVEFGAVQESGHTVWVNVNAAPLPFDDWRAIVAAVDVTEQVEAKQALERRHRELQELTAELEAYDHTVAHDLKNPLSMIVGSADLLAAVLDDMEGEGPQRMLNNILHGSLRLKDIVDSLLLLASSRSEQVKVEPVDMGWIVARAREEVAPLAERSGGRIVEPDRWPAALGYAPWLQSVWANYLSNALKYGGDRPQIELGAQERGNGVVRFWVRDNGPGLTEEEQGKLFVQFSRLDRPEKLGHGLGLAIVRRIVERLGGEVGVDSRPDEGSTFWFTLPAA
ncbi:MAG TPA: PAS domain-containing protein [Anaerolineae bacterium]|nr:PAS domain-containing protein [Anaerolineae bacterium]